MLAKFTEAEKALISTLSPYEKTIAEFQPQYPVPITREYIQDHLLLALTQRDDEEFQPAMTLMYTMSEEVVIDEALLHAFEQALLEDWHHRHEDIAMILQRLKSPSSVPCLFQTATRPVDYLKNDEFLALPRKCLWALGSINTPEALAMIYKLGESDNELLRKHVQEQLVRLGLAEEEEEEEEDEA